MPKEQPRFPDIPKPLRKELRQMASELDRIDALPDDEVRRELQKYTQSPKIRVLIQDIKDSKEIKEAQKKEVLAAIGAELRDLNKDLDIADADEKLPREDLPEKEEEIGEPGEIGKPDVPQIQIPESKKTDAPATENKEDEVASPTVEITPLKREILELELPELQKEQVPRAMPVLEHEEIAKGAISPYLDIPLPERVTQIYQSFENTSNLKTGTYIDRGISSYLTTTKEISHIITQGETARMLKKTYRKDLLERLIKGSISSTTIIRVFKEKVAAQADPTEKSIRIALSDAITHAFEEYVTKYFRTLEKEKSWLYITPEQILEKNYDEVLNYAVRANRKDLNLMQYSKRRAQEWDEKYQPKWNEWYGEIWKNRNPHIRKLLDATNMGDVCVFVDNRKSNNESTPGQRAYVIQKVPAETAGHYNPKLVRVYPISSGRQNSAKRNKSNSGGTPVGLHKISIHDTSADKKRLERVSTYTNHIYFPRFEAEKADPGRVIKKETYQRWHVSSFLKGGGAVMTSMAYEFVGLEDGLNAGSWNMQTEGWGINFHGTNRENTVWPGHGNSGGCIRMNNMHAIELGLLMATNLVDSEGNRRESAGCPTYLMPEDGEYARVVREAAGLYKKGTGKDSPYKSLIDN